MITKKFKLVKKIANRYFGYTNCEKFVLLTFDNNYVYQAINLMMSISKFNKNVSFICLCNELSGDKEKELFAAFTSPTGILLYEYEMLFTFSSLRWVPTTVYRVFSPYLIDEPIDKVLYLDADMICTGNLDKLFELNDYYICMATEIGANIFVSEVRNGIQHVLNDSLLYCNAGTALINLKKIHNTYTFDEIFNCFFEKIDELRFLDQDFLNWFFSDKLVRINGFIYDFQPYELKGSTFYKQALNNAKLIHFTSGKPWDRDCDLWLMRIYLKHSVYKPMICLVKHEIKRNIQLFPSKKATHIFKKLVNRS
jgi:lipopolysaccharide biosynthesis glycosyltransferase